MLTILAIVGVAALLAFVLAGWFYYACEGSVWGWMATINLADTAVHLTSLLVSLVASLFSGGDS